MINDMIADALTRIRNAALRKITVTTLLHSNIVVGILNVLKQKDYIKEFNVIDGKNNKKSIEVVLKYDKHENSVINEIKRVSKSGRRVYKISSDIKKFKNGYGTIILSTSKGIISNDEAYSNNTGGEVLCTVW
jgi:small subunit ribosomal protein S8